MSQKRSPKSPFPLDAACEDVAAFFNISTYKISTLVRNSIVDVLNSNFNNVNYSVLASEKNSNEISLIAKGSKNGAIQEIRLLFRLVFPRGSARGSLSNLKILKISRKIAGKTEVVAREIL